LSLEPAASVSGTALQRFIELADGLSLGDSYVALKPLNTALAGAAAG
jgi:hypothetical protein